jgi:hypothetical protein
LGCRYCGVEEEENKIFVVEFADAVAHPGTVMVHALDAFFTDFAVMKTGLFYEIAFKAVADFV